MKRDITFIPWLIKCLHRVESWLASEDNDYTEAKSDFVDLAPTDKADKDGIYSKALLFATKNPKVRNIALTGPYGSGKSSIIQSFLKNYHGATLHISLAAFVPDSEKPKSSRVNRQEIERSILQQMLYGPDADKLPLSRFKRIQSPTKLSIVKSLFLMFGTLSVMYVFHQREKIINGNFFEPLFSYNLGILVLATVCLWVVVHYLYVASFGLSLKSISLKDVEIRPTDDDKTSILNRHLDEIIYFFQSTDYDLVIIEDLDRFEDADIFITLREINSLVNQNSGVKRAIRFLYALRDDMFVNTDRTKFFEFIIPVIPIINTSNSIDMMLKHGQRLKIAKLLDKQFIKEVSRYLNDLRLIQNIFNEYSIYVSSLETDGDNTLDPNKLLAILIYKNIYPSDFEKLHQGKGILAGILNDKEKFIANAAEQYREEITDISKSISDAEKQIPLNIRELRMIYLMALSNKIINANMVKSDSVSSWIHLVDLAENDKFDELINSRRIYWRDAYNNSNSIDISKLQNEVDPLKSYDQRKEEIEYKSSENKRDSLNRIRDLRSKIAKIRITKLNELLQLNIEEISDRLKGFNENGELARFLILEGYLDDSYYQYTSLFHAGRLSPNDNKFLIQIRAYVTPEPNFPIDNVKEVIDAMRDDDFRQTYVLNIKIVDNILSEKTIYLAQKQKLFSLISNEFDKCEDFLIDYYSSGQYIKELLLGLSDEWKYLVKTFIDSNNSLSHVSQLISNLPPKLLKELSNKFEDLPIFVQDNLQAILEILPDLDPINLISINIEINDLKAIKEYSEIARSMSEKGLFELSIENIEFVYQEILGKRNLDSLRKKNFTTLRSINYKPLIEKLESDFSYYLHNILLELEENSEEEAPAILDIVRRHEELDSSDLREFLNRQTSRLPTLDRIPEAVYSMLFETNKIEPTWGSCLTFMESEQFEPDSLVNYFDQDDICKALLKESLPDGKEREDLALFFVKSESLSDDRYREYICAFPLTFSNILEGLGLTKIQILIESKKLTFNNKNLDFLDQYRDLQLKFIVDNIDKFLATPSLYELEDDYLEDLLKSDISNANKIEIIKLMDLDEAIGRPERLAIIGKIIKDADADISHINEGLAKEIVINSSPIEIQILLLNKFNSLISNDVIYQILTNLPEPFCRIKIGGWSVRIPHSSENLKLVEWLKSRDIISSYSEDLHKYSDDKIRVNLYRK